MKLKMIRISVTPTKDQSISLPAGLEGEKAGTLKFVEDEESSTHDAIILGVLSQ